MEQEINEVSISGTTRIDPNCLTEREKMLINKVWEIRDRYAPSLPPNDVLMECHELFAVAHNLIIRRAVDLFLSVMSISLGRGEEIEEWYVKLHFYNFMADLLDCIENVRRWSERDRAEFLRDMKESDMMDKAFRFPRGGNNEIKKKAAKTKRGGNDDA